MNVNGEVVAALCLSHWPRSAAVPAAASPDWLNALYGLRLSATSTMLVRLLVWDARYAVSCARLLLHSVFATLAALDQVVIVVPAKAARSEYHPQNYYYSCRARTKRSKSRRLP